MDNDDDGSVKEDCGTGFFAWIAEFFRENLAGFGDGIAGLFDGLGNVAGARRVREKRTLVGHCSLCEYRTILREDDGSRAALRVRPEVSSSE